MNDPAPRPDADLDALFALARTRRPDTSAAEFAFETRLMARLRAQEDSGSVWAKASWRLIPFFAIGMVALTLWHTEVVSETNEAEQTCYAENPVNLDSWNNLN